MCSISELINEQSKEYILGKYFQEVYLKFPSDYSYKRFIFYITCLSPETWGIGLGLGFFPSLVSLAGHLCYYS